MDLEDRQMQFRVRELNRPHNSDHETVAGTFTEGVSVTNFTPEAAVFLDGSRIILGLQYGDVVEPRISGSPLRIYL